MDALQFDRWARGISQSLSRRQTIFATLLGGSILIRGANETVAKKKRRKKKIKRNSFGCVNVGGACKNAGQCCSGICQGKKCKAHDGGGCERGQSNSVCGGTNVTCTTGSGFPAGNCTTTTGNTGYCSGDTFCATCRRDVDCQVEFGPLAACIVCAGCTEGTACASPDDLG
jgi:hypothetical protein